MRGWEVTKYGDDHKVVIYEWPLWCSTLSSLIVWLCEHTNSITHDLCQKVWCDRLEPLKYEVAELPISKELALKIAPGLEELGS